MTRDEILQLDETALAALCKFDTFRGTGPGGQKRNKTESAVRAVHTATGLSAFDDTTRSQHTNKHNALAKLRLEMALKLREIPTPWNGPVPPHKSPEFVQWIGRAIDALVQTEFKISDAAHFLGLSTAHFVKILQDSPATWQFINSEREKHGLAKLK